LHFLLIDHFTVEVKYERVEATNQTELTDGRHVLVGNTGVATQLLTTPLALAKNQVGELTLSVGLLPGANTSGRK